MDAAPDPKFHAIEQEIAVLSGATGAWARLAPVDLLPLLEQLRWNALSSAANWVAQSAEAKGLPEASPLRGEEWLSGPYALISAINALIRSLSNLAKDRSPVAGLTVRTLDNGRTAISVLPTSLRERVLFSGYSAEVWMEHGVTKENLTKHAARRFRTSVQPGVTLILGAGNINAIPVLDALYKMIIEGQVCLVKLSPVNDYLLDTFNTIFAPLVGPGYIRFVTGNAGVGSRLCEHPEVHSIHLTGTLKTHDTIVFGAGRDGARRKEARAPRNPRPITSELGGVSASIVVPGTWSDADFRFQAEHLVTQKLHNGGFNCTASQLVILPAGWDGSVRLLQHLRQVLQEVVDQRPSFYPGTEERRQAVLTAHPRAQVIGTRAPFLLVEHLNPDADDMLYREEAFGPVWGILDLRYSTVDEYIARAVEFANRKLMGSLACQLIVHPRTSREHREALENAINDLKYGCVGVNAWSGVGFALPMARWGAFPGHLPHDAQSGIGVVHNALMLERTEKLVLRGPFQPFPRTVSRGRLHTSPKPIWFVTHRGAARAAEALTRLEATGNLGQYAQAVRAAFDHGGG
ncbi:MAG: aldehyde dehydrogenase family protein [Myxococcota bacterium]